MASAVELQLQWLLSKVLNPQFSPGVLQTCFNWGATRDAWHYSSRSDLRKKNMQLANWETIELSPTATDASAWGCFSLAFPSLGISPSNSTICSCSTDGVWIKTTSKTYADKITGANTKINNQERILPPMHAVARQTTMCRLFTRAWCSY